MARMERNAPRRSVRLLIGLGLVIAGLCAGILTMLVVGRMTGAEGPRVVERVELGPPAVSNDRRAAVRDSGAAPSMPLAQLNNRFKTIASEVTPSVVYILVELGEAEAEELTGPERFFRRPRQSVGSGVIVSEDGYIVTNNHVISGAGEIRVTLADKRQFEARVVGADPSTDLAVLKIDAEGLPAIPIGNSDGVDVGEWVIAVGNPFRLTSTVTAGIVGALGRQVNIIDGSFGIENFIQTDAAISPGNSGGPLVNLRGEMIGINTAIASRSGAYEGYGFSVPSNLMRRVVSDLIAYGQVRRGYLGVSIQGVDASAAQEIGLDRIRGVYVAPTRTGGAAHEAGIRAGDVVLSIDGQPVDAPNRLQGLVARYQPGDEIALTVWRDGALRRFRVELMGRDEEWISSVREEESAPEPEPERRIPELAPSPQLFELEAWGLGLRSATDAERQAFGAEGAYLSYVEQGSPAAVAGVPRDALLTAVEGAPTASVDDALEALGTAEGPTVLFRVQRRSGISAFYEVEVP